MRKFEGLGERLSGRLRLLGYWKRDRPDILGFCREKGYRPQYVYAWLKDRVPSYANLRRLAGDLDVSMAWIMFGRDPADGAPASGLAPSAPAPAPGTRAARPAASPPPSGGPALLDVRRLREVMDRLVQLEAELQAIFQAFPDGYFWLDREGTVTAYTAGRGFDMPVGPERFLGRRLGDLLPPDVAEPLQQGIRRALGGEPLVAVESRLVVRDRERTVETRMVPLPAPAEGDRRVLAIVRDITQRKRTEDATRALAETGREAAVTPDLAQVAQRIADSLLALLDVRASAVFRLDRATGEPMPVAWAGVRRPLSAAGMALLRASGLSGLVVREGRSAQTPDILGDARLILPPDVRALLEQAASQSALAVPLAAHGQIIGALIVGDHPGRQYGAEEVRLVERFADQAALALENARLFAEAARRRQETEELARTARGLTETLDGAAIGERTVTAVRRLFGAQGAEIRLLEADGGLRALAADGPVHAQAPPGHVLPPGADVAGIATRTGKPAWSPDVQADPGVAVPEDLRAVYGETGVHAVLAVPLRVRGAIVGTLQVAVRESRSFDGDEVAVLEAFADQAALALGQSPLFADSSKNFT